MNSQEINIEKYHNRILRSLNKNKINNVKIEPLMYNSKKYPNRKGNIILTKNREERYYYFEEIVDASTKRENIITVIMFNPALASTQKPDSTINNVYKIIKNKTSYKYFEIFNIITVRNPHPENLSYNNYFENVNLLKKLINLNKNSKELLLAWGDLLDKDIKRYLNKQDADNIKNDIYVNIVKDCNLFAVGITNYKNPMHLSTKNNPQINKNIEKLEIFPIPIQMNKQLKIISPNWT